MAPWSLNFLGIGNGNENGNGNDIGKWIKAWEWMGFTENVFNILFLFYRNGFLETIGS